MPVTDRLRTALADRYQIQREIGAGGMATVYLARDIKHDRDVALKVLRSDLSAVIGTERFLSEVRISARLDHPHILTLIDSGEADGILYYVLPYVRGESLRSKIEREKQLSVDEALSITKQVASALDYAHERGVVHRDIKPENILLHEGEAVLADFGIALAVKEAGGNRLTETGLSLGTPQYMSPEQATGDRALDKRSDIYSLGAVFYEMIAGEPPVTGATAQAMIAKLITERPVKLRVVRDTIPLSMERAADKALSKVPADRFSSAGEFARALSSAATENDDDRSKTRGWMKPAAIAAAVIVAIGATLVAYKNFGRESSDTVTFGDRRQLTSTGKVMTPAISDDGKMVAYLVNDCSDSACVLSIDIQDAAGGSPKRVIEGLGSVQTLSVSPDRRNVIFTGSYKKTFGAFIVPTLGGEPRFLAAGYASFYAGGDSLLLVKGFGSARRYWVFVTGLDGASGDSILVDKPGDGMPVVVVIPGTSRIVYTRVYNRNSTWNVMERSGEHLSTITLPRGQYRYAAISSDALWLRPQAPGTTQGKIVRIALDAGKGRLSQRLDTVYTGSVSGFGITADGQSVVVDEGKTEATAWFAPMRDFLIGKWNDAGRIASGTRRFGYSIEPEGKVAAFTEEGGSSESDGSSWSIVSLDGGKSSPIPGRHIYAGMIDSTEVMLIDRTGPGMFALSLWNRHTTKRSAGFSVPDSNARYADRVHGYGWSWLPVDGKTIAIKRDGEPSPRMFKVPKWYRYIYQTSISRDGRNIAFIGWNDPREDSTGIGIMSVPDGRMRHVKSFYTEGMGIKFLSDGSLFLGMNDAPNTWSYATMTLDGVVKPLGRPPRMHDNWDVAANMSRALVTTSRYQGDVWLMKVSRK